MATSQVKPRLRLFPAYRVAHSNLCWRLRYMATHTRDAHASGAFKTYMPATRYISRGTAAARRLNTTPGHAVRKPLWSCFCAAYGGAQTSPPRHRAHKTRRILYLAARGTFSGTNAFAAHSFACASHGRHFPVFSSLSDGCRSISCHYACARVVLIRHLTNRYWR